MKAKEVFVIFIAFTLLLATFCVVALTTGYLDKFVGEPVSQSGSAIVKATSNSPDVQDSASGLTAPSQKPESKPKPLTASINLVNSHISKRQIETRPVEYRDIRTERKNSDTRKNFINRECLEGSQAPDPNEDKKQAAVKSIE